MQNPILANLRRAAACAGAITAAGCTTLDEPVREIVAKDDAVYAAAFSRKQVRSGLPAHWLPYILLGKLLPVMYVLERQK